MLKGKDQIKSGRRGDDDDDDDDDDDGRTGRSTSRLVKGQNKFMSMF